MGNLNLTEREILASLDKIESHLKRKVFKFYQPSTSFSPNDSVSVNKEARLMLDFVGLNDYTAIITYSKTKQNEGGNIELDNAKEIFIEISSDIKNYKDRVLAVMAHEICHKVLFINGLYYRYPTPQIENEKLTDLTTIYIGFGKLTLNGCYGQYQSYNKKDNIVTTHSEEIGYLSRKNYAFAYQAVCARYGIDIDKNGLNKYALETISESDSDKMFLPSTQHLRNLIKETQKYSAIKTNAIVTLEYILNKIKDNISIKHEIIYNDLFEPFDFNSNEVENPFYAMEMYKKYKNSPQDEESQIIINSLYSAIELLKQSVPVDEKFLLTLECPHCGYKKENALKEHKMAFMKCPQCGYLFSWDATFSKEQKTEEKKQSFFSKLSSLINH